LNPLVTIITPSFNQVLYLPDAIRSVLSQDYTPIEYWVVDGASTDGSVQVIQEYSDRLAGWISERDAGQSEAINKGLSKAQGEIVAWLNSDDFYLPQAVSRAVEMFQSDRDLGMVFGNALTVDQHGWPLKWLGFGDWGLQELVKFRIICQPAVFMRRNMLEKAGFLDPSYNFMLDHHLWIRIAELAPILYAGGSKGKSGTPSFPWAAARHHPGAKNVSQSQEFSREIMRLLEWMHTIPNLERIIQKDRRGVQSGAYRLSARYLLDGGKYREALRDYLLAAGSNPGFALKHWHRMLYTVLGGIGFGRILDRLRYPYQLRGQKQLASELITNSEASGKILDGWPGLHLTQM
jgi:glycosyltransferase involved in cell wall biosynthesis